MPSRWPSSARGTSSARSGPTGAIRRPRGSPRPSDSPPWPTGSRRSWPARPGRPTPPSAWRSPRCSTTRSGTPPPPGSGPRRWRPTRSSVTTAGRSTATSRPAPPPWRLPAGGRMSRRPTPPRRPSCDARPWTGSGPSWRPGRRSSTPATPRPAPSAPGRSATGRWTPTWPASATGTPSRRSPPTSGGPGRPSGRTSMRS